MTVKELRLGVRKRHPVNRPAAASGSLKDGGKLRAWFREVVRFEDGRWLSPNGNGAPAQIDRALMERLADTGREHVGSRETQRGQDRVAGFLESVGAAPPHLNGGAASLNTSADIASLASIPIRAIPRRPAESDARERDETAIDLVRAAGLAPILVMLTMIARGSPIRVLVIGSLSCLLFVLLRRTSESLLPLALGRTNRTAAVATFVFSTILLIAARVSGVAVEPWTVVAFGGAAFALLALFDVGPRRQRVLLVGQGGGSAELLDDLAKSPNVFEVVATVDAPHILDENMTDGSGCESSAELGLAIERHQPDLVVVNVRSGRQEVFGALLDVAGSGFRVVGLPEFYEHAFGRVPVAHLTPAWFMSLLQFHQRSYTAVAKRSFDLVVVALATLVVLPFLPLIALLVGRPMFFRQVRVGQWGKTFMMYKIRTMRVGAEELGHPVFASLDDPRVTRVGRVLRKTRIDELPQLWNVLLGDMSIVGPRPERPEFDSRLAEEIPGWVRRNMVKPGITGWAQINARYADDTESTVAKLSYDLWYLRHSSILIDLMICFRTLPRLVVGSGGR